mmetsp:Transcript_115000/g.330327  ORF Transcript_115000/g.330327 Transcript_115000/m.330327 type:complete len:652 (+) Transcript_115000:189-2144(+)
MDGKPNSVRSVCLQKAQGRPGQYYEAVQKLGEGAFGVAQLVRDKRSSVLRVLKTINKRQSQVPSGQLDIEIHNLKACDHPHIIRLFEYYEDYENVYLIMEHASGGELRQVLEQQKAEGLNLPELWVSLVVKQCLTAIAYVHSQGIIHKDLKSENILLLQAVNVNDPQSQPHAVIIDLGIAEIFAARLGRRARCTVVAGTPTHMAPEVWRGNFGPVADVWSLGVVLFELLAGDIPFQCSSLNSAQEWLRMHRAGPNWSLLSHVSKGGRAICQRMLNWDERMRPTAQQCLGHSWFKDPGVTETSAEHAAEAAAEEAPAPLQSARGPPSDAVVQAVGDFMGRSKFEKGILLQVASQLHIAQMTKVYEVFTAADKDKSGTLTTSELAQVLTSIGVEKGAAEEYASCADMDSNGRVEYTELASACIGLVYSELRGLLWQSCCILDVDGNGMLSPDEVRAVMMRTELVQHGFPGNASQSHIQEVIAGMDVDGNGQISFEELCRVFLPRPIVGPSSGQDPGTARGTNGQADQAAARKFVMKDEEFAQLLDEIEAAHHATHAAVAQKDLQLERTESLDLGISVDFAADEPVMGVAEAAAVESSPPPAVGLADPRVVGLCHGADVEEAWDDGPPPPPPPHGLSVDEELSHLLADIAANGP